MTRTATAVLTLLLAGCYPYPPPALAPATQPAGPATGALMWTAPAAAPAPTVILVSIDGFRADYLDRGITPNLSRLAAGGVTAAMRPSFPSKTFPNHWTLVTGLVPDRHGIVANSFEDPARPGERFTMASDDPAWWNAAEPIWVTAERAGIATATMFWPGSSVAWGGTRTRNTDSGGTRPRDWWPYAKPVTERQRVDGVLDWLRRPIANRPRLVTLYFDTVDTVGHRSGPDSPATDAAIRDADALIGRLTEGLAQLRQTANLVIVADHGMAAISPTRQVVLDRLLPTGSYRTIDAGAYASIVPAEGQEGAVAAALAQPVRGMTCWPKARIPARLHYGRNPRVAPILCLADVGWSIVRTADERSEGGNHGYDPAAREMASLFIATGPAFATGRRLAPFDNVDVAPLLRRLLTLPHDPALDGTDRTFRSVLR